MLYYILEQQKNAFLGYKNKKFKKGLLQGYAKVVSKNWLFFHLFFFRQYRPGKCSLLYSRAKNAFLGYKNKRFKKSKYKNVSIGGSPWFWSKIGFFPFFFLGNKGEENVLYYILERKKAFLGYKNTKFKKSKN